MVPAVHGRDISGDVPFMVDVLTGVVLIGGKNDGLELLQVVEDCRKALVNIVTLDRLLYPLPASKAMGLCHLELRANFLKTQFILLVF